MVKLYYVPQTRAHRARWMLEELGVPYELVRVDVAAKQNKTPEYLAIHPHGHVPAIQDGGMTMFESAAICLYLADRYPEAGLAPPPGSVERGPYYQWMVYAMSELEPTIAAVGLHTRMLPEAERVPALADRGRRLFGECARVLKDALRDRPYLLGERFTAADVMIGGVLGWAKVLGLLEDQPEVKAYLKSLTERPASKRARAD